MKISRSGRRASVGLLSAGAVVAALLTGTPTAGAADTQAAVRAAEQPATGTGEKADDARQFVDGRYVVVLREPAAAAYDGSDSRFAATRAPEGGQYRDDTPAARAYNRHLRGTHAKMARELGTKVVKSFTVATNGFVAELTAGQAREAATDKRVMLLEKSTMVETTTWNTPDFLGLESDNGVWNKVGGRRNAGNGTVVGILDTGIWPESKSFRGLPLSGKPKTRWDITRDGNATRMEKIDGNVFHGLCQDGEEWDVSDCNTKLVGARWFGDEFLFFYGDDLTEYEYESTRDGDGHGSHTGGTAAGQVKGNVNVSGRHFGKIAGVAPGARVAAYKVCWNANSAAGCFNFDMLSAIDQAVIDGVDVINFSIGGGPSPELDSIELAFLNAARSGIFVAASAGNSGPGATTLDHASPWLTTVGASTHYPFVGTVKLGDGTLIKGASSMENGIGMTMLVDAADAALAGEDPGDAELCIPGTLDPALVSNKIVVCKRGAIARVDKSFAVDEAGGKGMIMYNPTPNSTNADAHFVPSVHIPDTEAGSLLDYMDANPGSARAALKPKNLTGDPTYVPQMAEFSSRGPTEVADGDLLKPDVTAPGVDVLAAVAPGPNYGRNYDLLSGTSMSSPHVAGLGALLAAKYPNWTPMDIKSALMTSSKRARTENGGYLKDAFAQGAGHVHPKKALDPGLFVTADYEDWLGFLTGEGFFTGVPEIPANQLNLPSMAEGAATEPVTFSRSFRASEKGKWEVTSKMPGFELTTNRPGIRSDRINDVIDMDFTFTRTTAPFGEWTTGEIVLNGPTKLRLPVAIRPLALEAPGWVEGTGTDGDVEVPITAGFTGDQPVGLNGLTEGSAAMGDVAVGGEEYHCVTVPTDTKTAVFDLDGIDDTSDLDLFVVESTSCDINDAYALAGQSATGAADERVVLENPTPGTYIGVVSGFASGADGEPMPWEHHFLPLIPGPGVGNLMATPNPVPVVQGEETSFDVSWSGLDPDKVYGGFLTYEGSAAETVVVVNTNGGGS